MDVQRDILRGPFHESRSLLLWSTGLGRLHGSSKWRVLNMRETANHEGRPMQTRNAISPIVTLVLIGVTWIGLQPGTTRTVILVVLAIVFVREVTRLVRSLRKAE